jgi:uncharacterized protein YbgA (DUF1722 family)
MGKLVARAKEISLEELHERYQALFMEALSFMCHPSGAYTPE